MAGVPDEENRESAVVRVVGSWEGRDKEAALVGGRIRGVTCEVEEVRNGRNETSEDVAGSGPDRSASKGVLRLEKVAIRSLVEDNAAGRRAGACVDEMDEHPGEEGPCSEVVA